MKYKCRANISYVVYVEAKTVEEAEQCVFEALADDVTSGIIRLDLFDNEAGGFGLRFPTLDSVDIDFTKSGESKRTTHTGTGRVI